MGRVAARHVWMVLPGKVSPGHLDGLCARVEGQPEYGEWVSWHPISLPGGPLDPRQTVFPGPNLCRPQPPQSPALDRFGRVASPTFMARHKRSHRGRWVRLVIIVGTLTGLGAAYRFALRYREQAGLPHRSPVQTSPRDFGLDFEEVQIPAGQSRLAGWFVPAGPAAPTATSEPRPGIVVVHGWESNRGRTFAHVRYLNAAGFHCLVFDVRGHGDSPEEYLPMNVPEFAEDTQAAVKWLAARPEVSAVGVLGHSMGGAGAIVAASREPAIRAVVSLSAPADLVRMTRKTFEMAEMNIPGPVATPLAFLTAAVLLRPRRDSLADASAMVAAAKYQRPLLLIHGAQDHGVPVAHAGLIQRAALETREPDDPPVDVLILPGFGHRWLYEDEDCRRRTAAFFAAALGGPLAPEEAGERAAACLVERPADPVYGFGAITSKTPPATAITTEN